jgi:protein SCO1/2
MATISEKAEVSHKKRPLRTILLFFGGVAALFLLGWLAWGWLVPPSYNGQVIDAQTPVTNFTLTGPGGNPISLVDFRDKVVMIYFGYTYCPDVCPATMVELRTAVEGLGQRAENVQVLMVSLDPERDSPEVLEKYVAHFNDSFIGLTGTEDEIITASTPLGIFYEREEGSAATGYLVNHTATVMVLDKRGYLRLVYPFDTPGEAMTEDLKHLVRE